MSDTPFDPRRPPIYAMWGDHPIPDLRRTPREHWVEVLRRTAPHAIGFVAEQFDDEELRAAARSARDEARFEGPIRETVPHEAVQYPPSLPGEGVAAGSWRRDRQVNFRLPPPVFAELERAAELVRMRPTTLARLLVTRGVTQILREATERG
jgi:hypothetical protein